MIWAKTDPLRLRTVEIFPSLFATYFCQEACHNFSSVHSVPFHLMLLQGLHQMLRLCSTSSVNQKKYQCGVWMKYSRGAPVNMIEKRLMPIVMA